MYLSPSFSERTEAEKRVLRTLRGSSGFRLFWLDVVRPLLTACAAREIVEVGADEGDNTELLLEYVAATPGGALTVIEPFVSARLQQVVRSGAGRILVEKSAKAIPRLQRLPDAVLLEGDLNYDAVATDLHALDLLAQARGGDFPLVFVRSVSWPYAMRDMYYDPEATDTPARHPYRRAGMNPWEPGLIGRYINYEFANSLSEGGERNGVLTAVRDFVSAHSAALDLLTLPFHNGLAIVYRRGSSADTFIAARLRPPAQLALLLETCELARLNGILEPLTRTPAALRGPRSEQVREAVAGLAALVRGPLNRLFGRRSERVAS